MGNGEDKGLSFNRIRISKEASTRLSRLKARTGLTPNVLSRLALCLSLNESGTPNSDSYDEDGQEFNRFTLTGEWDMLFVALLKERLVKDGFDPTLELLPQFKGHLNRGVLTLFTRVRSLPDLYDLLPKESAVKAHEKHFLEEENGS